MYQPHIQNSKKLPCKEKLLFKHVEATVFNGALAQTSTFIERWLE
jgi:hypothetical protein